MLKMGIKTVCSRTRCLIRQKKILGRDTSREKVMTVMGLQDEEIEQAQRERGERMEDELKAHREKEPIMRNKKDNTKALEVLGQDPSTDKVMSVMGIDKDSVEAALQEEYERKEKDFRRKRNNTGAVDKRNSLKALELLGHDPSKEKVMVFLGLDPEELVEAEQEHAEQFEEHLQVLRSRNGSRNKKETAKALKVLGMNPSKSKVSDILGMDEEELEDAEAEEIEYREQKVKKQRENVDCLNKKNIQKALNILGHDPSERKVENKLGVASTITSRYDFYSDKSSLFSHFTISVGMIIIFGVIYFYNHS